MVAAGVGSNNRLSSSVNPDRTPPLSPKTAESPAPPPPPTDTVVSGAPSAAPGVVPSPLGPGAALATPGGATGIGAAGSTRVTTTPPAVSSAAADPYAPTAASPTRAAKGFFGVLFDVLLAPFRFILGLFGVSLAPSATTRLNASELEHGRAVTSRPSGVPDTGQRGPHPVKSFQVEMPGDDGKLHKATVFAPEGPGPFPPLIHSHGLWSDPSRHAGSASHFASWGMIVIVPEAAHGSDHPTENAKDLEAYVDWVMKRPAVLGSKLTTAHGVGLSGHSFGGLTSMLAATHPGVAAAVALDPADAGGVGKAAAAAIRVPTAFVVGTPEPVNQLGNGRDIYAAAGGDKQLVVVANAHHSDFENNHTDGAKNYYNEVAMRHAVGFMLYQLGGGERFAGYVNGGAELAAGRAAGDIR